MWARFPLSSVDQVNSSVAKECTINDFCYLGLASVVNHRCTVGPTRLPKLEVDRIRQQATSAVGRCLRGSLEE